MGIENFESPVTQRQFIWFARYNDGTFFTEFENDGKENSFYDINKENLKEFGLIGHGAKYSFTTEDGTFTVFNPDGTKYTFVFNLDDEAQKLIRLSKNSDTSPFNDIIQLKRFYTDFEIKDLIVRTAMAALAPSLLKGFLQTKKLIGDTIEEPAKEPIVDQQLFGYKTCIEVPGRGQLHFKVIFKLNFNSPCELEFRFAPSFDLKGVMTVQLNGKSIAPTEINVTNGRSVVVVKRMSGSDPAEGQNA